MQQVMSVEHLNCQNTSDVARANFGARRAHAADTGSAWAKQLKHEKT